MPSEILYAKLSEPSPGNIAVFKSNTKSSDGPVVLGLKTVYDVAVVCHSASLFK